MRDQFWFGIWISLCVHFQTFPFFSFSQTADAVVLLDSIKTQQTLIQCPSSSVWLAVCYWTGCADTHNPSDRGVHVVLVGTCCVYVRFTRSSDWTPIRHPLITCISRPTCQANRGLETMVIVFNRLNSVVYVTRQKFVDASFDEEWLIFINYGWNKKQCQNSRKSVARIRSKQYQGCLRAGAWPNIQSI